MLRNLKNLGRSRVLIGGSILAGGIVASAVVSGFFSGRNDGPPPQVDVEINKNGIRAGAKPQPGVTIKARDIKASNGGDATVVRTQPSARERTMDITVRDVIAKDSKSTAGVLSHDKNESASKPAL